MKTVRLIAAALLATAVALPAVPSLINYQGHLTDADGTPLGSPTPVNRKLVFRLYDDANAGTRLWTEEHTVTLVDGQFSILLGNGIDATGTAADEGRPALGTVFAGGGERYLGITVDNGDNVINASDTEIAPRQRLTSTAYALRAGSADRIASGSDLQVGPDSNHGLGFYDGGRTFNGATIDGPVLYGFSGGALGSVNGATQSTALRWESDGDVSISKDLGTVGLAVSQNATIAGTLGVTGATSLSSLSVSGTSTFTGTGTFQNGVVAKGVTLPGGFTPDPAFVGTAGNFLSFAHAGSSEDFIGYKSNTFYFRDSLGGGDTVQPSVDVGGSLAVGGSATVNGSATASGAMQAGHFRTGDNLYLYAAAGDSNHGIGRYDDFEATEGGRAIGKGINGPVVYGWQGGALGTRQNGNAKAALRWHRSGDVDVDGKLTENGKPVASGEEDLRIVRGTLSASTGNFTINKGAGFSVGTPRANWETYEITFATPFADIPSITANANFAGNVDHGRLFCSIWNVTSSGFTLRVHPDGGGTVQWSSISFIAAGPR